jgi:hypothetical protein
MNFKSFSKVTAALLLGSSTLFASFGTMNVSSSSHGTTTQSKDASLDFSWAQPTVSGGTTLNGYYYVLDTNISTLVKSTNTALAVNATSKTENVSVDGTYYFHIAPFATDGEIGATATFGPIEIDTTAPTALAASPTGGLFSAAQTVSMSASDTNSKSIYYTLDGTTPTSSSSLFSSAITIASTKTLQMIAIDAAGNESAVVSQSYTVTTTSNIAQFGNEIVANGTIANSSSGGSSSFVPQVTVEGQDALTDYKVKIDSGTFSAQTSKSVAIDITGLTEGAHTLGIIGFDGTSFQSESSPTELTFTVDNTAPSTTTLSPVSGSAITGTTSATITLASTGSSKIYYTIDGTTPTTTSSTTIQSSTLTVTPLTTTPFTIKAFSVDTAGNKSSVVTANYTHTVANPVVVVTTPNTPTDSGTTPADTTTVTETNTTTTTPSTETNTTTTTPDEVTTTETTKPEEVVETPTETVDTPEEVVEIPTDITTTAEPETSIVIETPTEVENADGTKTVTVTLTGTTEEIAIDIPQTATQTTQADGSLKIVSTSTSGSEVEVVIAPTGVISSSATVNGQKTELASSIAGSDIKVADNGSITMTTPTVTIDNGKNVQVTSTVSPTGTVSATLNVDGKDIKTPEYEAGTDIEIVTSNGKVAVKATTTMNNTLTFN